MNDENRYSPATTPADSRDLPAWRRLAVRHQRVLIIVAVLLALVLLAWLLKPKPTAPPPGRFAGGGPMPVVVAPAQTGDMPITLVGLGTVTPLATVTVQSQIAGQIMHIAFKEGQEVK